MTASSSRRHAGDDDHGNRATPLCGTQLDHQAWTPHRNDDLDGILTPVDRPSCR